MAGSRAGEGPGSRVLLILLLAYIFNKAYKTDGQEFSSIGSIRTVYYGAPRTLMIRAGVRF